MLIGPLSNLIHSLISSELTGLTFEQTLCCDEKAHTNEVGVDFSAVVVLAANSAIKPYGWNGWEGNTCIFKVGNYASTKCYGIGVSAGVSVGYTHGSFNSFDDIAGESELVTVGAGILGTFDVGVILGREKEIIGNFYGWALGGDLEASYARCMTDVDVWGVEETRYENLKCRCVMAGCSRRRRTKECFPADAEVVTPDGVRRMRDLRVGHSVMTADDSGETYFDVVYFFGHADPRPIIPYVKLDMSGVRAGEKFVLEVSKKHFIHVCKGRDMPCKSSDFFPAYAETVEPGDLLLVKIGNISMQLARVDASSVEPKVGLYNPYTLSGRLIVNNVLVSAHSEWVLDPWMPERFSCALPLIYQGLFTPGRLIYYLGGAQFTSQVADMLDVNNPQRVPETYGHGPSFLLASLCVTCAVLALGLRWSVRPRK